MTEIDATLVKQLIRAQFPQWAELPIAPVENSGWDNRTFRLGDSMSARLPSALRYVAQVEKEHRWLPELRPHLPFPIPVPLGLGIPGAGYPWPWLIYGWLDGKPADVGRIHDLNGFAVDLAHFLVALWGIDASRGPAAGAHNFHRGGSLTVYDTETRQSIGKLADMIDVALVNEIWEAALTTSWQAPPVWVHGDVAETNLLVKEGRLAAVIDFGARVSAIPLAISLSRGRSSIPLAGRNSGRLLRSIRPPESVRGAGRFGRPLSHCYDFATPIRTRQRRRTALSVISLTIMPERPRRANDRFGFFATGEEG
jgi:aminoglycoside phosphotransferase (APT) family kinase protein